MLLAFFVASVLLLLGVAARSTMPWLRTFYIPASVVGGLIGLFLLLPMDRFDFAATPVDGLLEQFRSWPGFLIAIVFAGMLLPPQESSATGDVKGVGREGLMVWIIALGQTATGCLLVWLVLGPWFDAPAALAILIETGFVGGHGTAASMGEVLASDTIGVDNGLALGTLVATIGLIYGVVSGVVWVNVGVRRGWLAQTHQSAAVSTEQHESPMDDSSKDDIDPWLRQSAYLSIAMVLGWAMHDTMTMLAHWTGTQSVLGDLPLFIYTLAAGLIVRRSLRLIGLDHTIDGEILARQTAIAMDILVVAAIASLDLIGAIGDLPIVAILCFGGAVWTAICLFLLSRRILPSEHWFELGLINYGMSTGTTATGFVLLRMVDPDLRTGAARDYALATPLSSPFVGGGMLTFAFPILVLGRVPLGWVAVGLWMVVFALTAIGIRSGGRADQSGLDKVDNSPNFDRNRSSS